jgi:hypothetical protein
MKNMMPQRVGATMTRRQHRRNDVLPHVQYPIVLAHVWRTMTPSGSNPAEQQKKKYLDWKSGSLAMPSIWSIL